MPTSQPCFRVTLSAEKLSELNQTALKAEMDRIKSDTKVRITSKAFTDHLEG